MNLNYPYYRLTTDLLTLFGSRGITYTFDGNVYRVPQVTQSNILYENIGNAVAMSTELYVPTNAQNLFDVSYTSSGMVGISSRKMYTNDIIALASSNVVGVPSLGRIILSKVSSIINLTRPISISQVFPGELSNVTSLDPKLTEAIWSTLLLPSTQQVILDEFYKANPNTFPTNPGTYTYHVSVSDPDIILVLNLESVFTYSAHNKSNKVTLKNDTCAIYLKKEVPTALYERLPPMGVLSNYSVIVESSSEVMVSSSTNEQSAFNAFDGSGSTFWSDPFGIPWTESQTTTDTKDSGTLYGEWLQIQTSYMFQPISVTIDCGSPASFLNFLLLASATGLSGSWEAIGVFNTNNGVNTYPLTVGAYRCFRVLIMTTNPGSPTRIHELYMTGFPYGRIRTSIAVSPPMTISIGEKHILITGEDKRLYAWGANESGQLGEGTFKSYEGDKVANIGSNVMSSIFGRLVDQMACDASRNIMIDTRGQAHHWAAYSSEAGSITPASLPINLMLSANSSLQGLTALACTCGSYYTFIIDTSGQLHGFGAAPSGIYLCAPRTIATPSNISIFGTSSLSSNNIMSLPRRGGKYHMLAIDASGRVHAWGQNTNGQVGNNTQTSVSYANAVNISLVASSVLSGKIIKHVAAGVLNSYAIDSTGKVYAWGYNATGLVGDGTRNLRILPVCISDVITNSIYNTNVTLVESSGVEGSHLYTMAVDTLGYVHFWGDITNGEFGSSPGIIFDKTINLSIIKTSNNPLQGSIVRSISSGPHNATCIDVLGQIYMWGGNGIFPVIWSETNSHDAILPSYGVCPCEEQPIDYRSISSAGISTLFSSSSQLSGCECYKAFGMGPIIDGHWISSSDKYDATTGAYAGTTITLVDGNIVSGEYVQFVIESHVVHVKRVILIDSMCGVETGMVCGSNDFGASWVSIANISNIAEGHRRTYTVESFNNSNDTFYTAVRIIVQKTKRNSSEFPTCASLRDALFIGYTQANTIPSVILGNKLSVFDNATSMITKNFYTASSSSNVSTSYLPFNGGQWYSATNRYNTTTGQYISPVALTIVDNTNIPGEWLQLEFGSRLTIASAIINLGNSGGTVRIVTSQDGSTWTTLASGIVPASTDKKFDASARTSLYVRAIVTSLNPGYSAANITLFRLKGFNPSPGLMVLSSPWLAEASAMIVNGFTSTLDGGLFVCGHTNQSMLTFYNADGKASTTLTFTADTSGLDGVVCKYSTSGDVQWCARAVGLLATSREFFRACTGTDDGGCVAVGAYANSTCTIQNGNGTIFTTLSAASNVNEGLVVKYSTSGLVQWICRSRSNKNFIDTDTFSASNYNSNVSSAPDGNIYIGGKFVGTITFTNSNNIDFTRTLSSAALIGATSVPDTTSGSYIACLSPSGMYKWVAKISATNNLHIKAMSSDPSTGGVIVCTERASSSTIVVYDSSGNAFSTQMSRPAPYQLLCKYSSTGSVIWVTSAYNASHLVSLPNGSIITVSDLTTTDVTLYNPDNTSFLTSFPFGYYPMATVSYSPSGFVQWVAIAYGLRVNSLVSMKDNGVCVMATCFSSTSPIRLYNANNVQAIDDFNYNGSLIIRYSANGNIQSVSKCSSVNGSSIGLNGSQDTSLYMAMNTNNRQVLYFNPDGSPGGKVSLSTNNPGVLSKTVVLKIPNIV